MLNNKSNLANYQAATDRWHKKAMEFESYLRDLGDQFAYINVVGPFGAGKTEFISALSEIPVHAQSVHIFYAQSSHPHYKDHPLPHLMGLDFGRITAEDNVHLFLFGVPGTTSLASFAFHEDDLDGKCLGTVFVVDHSRPETFREARRLLNRHFRAYEPSRRYVIAANKQDDPDAWDMDVFELALRKTSDEVFIPCSAFDKESVKNVILTLLYRARDSFED